MTYPPDPLVVTRTPATLSANLPDDVNALGAAVNDVVDELGPNPAGPHVTVQQRLTDTEDRVGQLEDNLAPTVTLPPLGTLTIGAQRGGGSIDAPENTLEAGRAAYQSGAAQLLDYRIQLAADGTLIVMQDDTLTRTTNRTGNVATLTAAQLGGVNIDPVSFFQVDSYPTFRVPTANDVLDEFGGRIVLLLVARTPAAVAPLCDLVVARGLTGSVYVGTDDPAQVPNIAGKGCLAYLSQTAAQMAAGLNHTALKAAGVALFGADMAAPDAQVSAAVTAGYPDGVLVAVVSLRYDRDRYTALGVRVINSGAPAYTSGKVPRNTVDTLDVGSWPRGYITAYSPAGRRLKADGVLELGDKTTPQSSVLLGEFTGTPANSTIEFDWRFTAPVTAGLGAWYLHLGVDDRAPDLTAATIVHNGYTIRLDTFGQVRIYKDATTGQTSTVIAEYPGGAAGTLKAGTWYRFRVRLTATAITASYLTGPTTRTATKTDADYRPAGGWALYAGARAHTGGVWQLRNINITTP